MTEHTLNPQNLNHIAARGITVPTYSRTSLIPGVVHLGLGAFHRAHQAMVFDALLQRGDTRWGVLGVAMRTTTLADALAGQAGLYAVQVASSAGSAWQVPGALLQTAVAARQPQRVQDALAAPATRWVTLTVTEKGYGPELAALLVKGLAQRQAAGLKGLTIASCDNLSDNGRKLQALCVNAATAQDPALARWIENTCAFPNSMVDRIVPAACAPRLQAAQEALGVADAAALGTEGFWEWVIEDRFVDAADAQLLASAGVNVVKDVRQFEEAKLRMLNGCHSVMACMGAVVGLPVIADCINQPAIAHMVYGLITHEISPHLTRQDWREYREALVKRWKNPDLKHSVHQIATDSSQKIPQRWPPCIEGQIRLGQSYERFAFAAAAWMRYCQGIDEHGQEYAMSDPMASKLKTLALEHAGDVQATVKALGSLTAIWGNALPQHAQWLTRVTYWLGLIQSQGVLAALTLANDQTSKNSLLSG